MVPSVRCALRPGLRFTLCTRRRAPPSRPPGGAPATPLASGGPGAPARSAAPQRSPSPATPDAPRRGCADGRAPLASAIVGELQGGPRMAGERVLIVDDDS